MKTEKSKSSKKEKKQQPEVEEEPIEEVEYYKKAFNLLEKKGKHTWNWAAFCFGSGWALYRKMYLFAFLGWILWEMLFKIGGNVLSYFLIPEAWANRTFGIFSELIIDKSDLFIATKLSFIKLVLVIFLGIIWGYYGNALYYMTVKKKIEKGDHLLDKYRPTSFWGVFAGIFSYIFMPIGDYFARRNFFKTHELKNNSVNAETINAYLNPGKENNWYSRSAIITSYVVFFLWVSSIVYGAYSIYQYYLSADEATKAEMLKCVKKTI